MEIESDRGLSGLILPLIAMSIIKEMKANLLTLKALLEETNRQR